MQAPGDLPVIKKLSNKIFPDRTKVNSYLFD